MSTEIDIAPCPICLLNILRPRIPHGVDASGVDCPRCGQFTITSTAEVVIRSQWANRRHLISAGVRTAWETKRIAPKVTSDNLEEFATSIPARSVSETLDRLLLLLAERTHNGIGDAHTFNPESDYPLLAVENDRSARMYINECERRGWLDPHGRLITIEGWQRIDALRATIPKSRQAFVAMWFDKSMDDAWLNGFKPAVEATNYYKPIRIDRLHHNEKIDDSIIAEIKRSGLLVADFTDHRGGVYFEAGFAMGFAYPSSGLALRGT